MRLLSKPCLLFFNIFLMQVNKPAQKTIYLHYFGQPDSVIFNLNGSWNRDGSAEPTYQLRKELRKMGYVLTTFRSLRDIKLNPEYVVFFNLTCSPQMIRQCAQKYGTTKIIAYLWEPPVKPNYLNYDFSLHKHFSKIFTWDQDLIDNKKYLQFYYPQPQLEVTKDIFPFNQKKLCALIARNQRFSHPK